MYREQQLVQTLSGYTVQCTGSNVFTKNANTTKSLDKRTVMWILLFDTLYHACVKTIYRNFSITSKRCNYTLSPGSDTINFYSKDLICMN